MTGSCLSNKILTLTYFPIVMLVFLIELIKTLQKRSDAIYSEHFSAAKFDNFIRNKVLYSFNIFAQNIDRGYTLEPSHRGGSNEYP